MRDSHTKLIRQTEMNQRPSTRKNKRGLRGGSETQFPGKLHDMLVYCERQGLGSIVSWIRGGLAFTVYDPEKLVSLLPVFFGQTKYRSFQRQLNMWHFERILDGPDKGSFFHPYFQKANKKLCSRMSRHFPPMQSLYDFDLSSRILLQNNDTLATRSCQPLYETHRQQDEKVAPFSTMECVTDSSQDNFISYQKRNSCQISTLPKNNESQCSSDALWNIVQKTDAANSEPIEPDPIPDYIPDPLEGTCQGIEPATPEAIETIFNDLNGAISLSVANGFPKP